MALCELLGADPYVNGNVGSGTVREMSEWVEYLTRAGSSPMADLRRANGRDEPWQVPFWGIGNELWGCGGNLRAEAYADLARQYATFCRDHGDNKLYRIAAGATNGDYAWTEALMKAIGCLGCGSEPRGFFQGVSFHYYTSPGTRPHRGSAIEFDTDDYYTTMVKAHTIEEMIRGHAAVMDVYDPHKKVGLILDEWGTWWDVEPGTNPGFLYQQNTLRDALVASIHFDAFHRHADRLFMANIAQTVNVLQAMILTDPDTDALVLTPTYHVFEMNTGHHDAASLAVHLRGVPQREVDGRELPMLSASASTKDDTALVSLTNLDADQPLTVVLDLRGRDATDHSARILTSPGIQAHNTSAQPEAVAPTKFHDIQQHARGLEIHLPPHSYVTVSLDFDDANGD
jgi:alpha-N-arabinofuranosidase